MTSVQHGDTTDPIETTSRPLCVDLDGTLVRTDLLAESIFALLKLNVLYLFLLPI